MKTIQETYKQVDSSMSEEAMRHEIMLHMKANGTVVTGERWLKLIFLSKSQLIEMCNMLNITNKTAS